MSELTRAHTPIRHDLLVLSVALLLTIGLIAANLPVFLAAGMALGCALLAYRPQKTSSPHALPFTLATLLLSFWLFLLFVRMGWATWPMHRAHSAAERWSLLYMQTALLFTLGPACLLYRANHPSDHFMRWGQFSPGSQPLAALLWLGVLLAWSCASVFLWKSSPESSIPVGLLVIAASKAGLYTLTEEVCFRGVLMPALARRNGFGFALLYQTALFTGFHAFLDPPFSSQPVFLLGVAALGVLFGWITYKIRGIGWAWLCHWAIGVTVEWSNLS